jgi:hypothetical protein
MQLMKTSKKKKKKKEERKRHQKCKAIQITIWELTTLLKQRLGISKLSKQGTQATRNIPIKYLLVQVPKELETTSVDVH